MKHILKSYKLKASLLAAVLSVVSLQSQAPSTTKTSISILKNNTPQSRYESILMTELRDKNSNKPKFRAAAFKLGSLLVNRAVECFETKNIVIETPLTAFEGESFSGSPELVSVMRSGDALLDVFITHFPDASVSKILVQRDEETASPKFFYMKLSPTIASGQPVIITEPMLATGGTLNMVLSLLKDKGVKEKNIIIASLCAAPEGLRYLEERYPDINVVVSALDERLNEKKYIVPGLGDFGDRFFGTK
ncbi:uracil phosphoribosyltransferase [Estrella lausannensis]|uniref:Uracil phosphoribosyltransferase n=1 Tax=Estrella lausannensis TaxID=483423 RepID=A0A0H5DSW6_9BACT|nr:uracil phosphoribosyltransferase [Estrella lausannensis]CRX39428.1 Putative uracil phosphoribosyltransferase [Estrella lausannensis]